MSDEALQRARELVLRHGWNATAYQILNPGISLWFSRRREAVVGHSDWRRVRVVAGAPVCAEADLSAVAEEFEADAAEAGCRVCYFAAGPRLEGVLGPRPGYARAGIGAQPIWHPARWPGILAGHPSLRAQLNRARNKGVTVREWPSHRAADDPSLRRCLDEWLRSRGAPTMHFLVEPDTLARLWDRRLFVAERGGSPVSFLVASPVPRRRGWLIEQIVRGDAAPNGVAETLVDAAFRAAAAADIEYLTLGLAPLSLRSGGEKIPNPLWLDLLFQWTREHGRRFYNFEGLESFKAKFAPDAWEPLYVLCNQREFTLRALLAIAAVFGGMPPFLFLGKTLAQGLRQEAAWLAATLRPQPIR